MSSSWSILSNGDTSVCAADAIPLAFLFGLYVTDGKIDSLNKIILATIYSVLNILPTESSLINSFFTPSTSLILLDDPNISCWIGYITARIHTEKISYFVSLVENILARHNVGIHSGHEVGTLPIVIGPDSLGNNLSKASAMGERRVFSKDPPLPNFSFTR